MVAGCVALGACGGGSGTSAPTAAATTVSGAVVKGPVAGAQVCAYTIIGGVRGAALGSCATTDTSGQYTLKLPVVSGAFWLEALGGSYTDEVSQASAALPPGVPMASLMTANGGNVSAMLTPLTTLAFNAARASALASGGTLDAAAFEAAVAQLIATFGLTAKLDIASALPVFGGAPNDYALVLFNISRMLAAGLTLEQMLVTTNPATLAAAYTAAAATPVTAGPGAPLVISAATPSSWNGTLGVGTVQFEHGSGSSTGGPFDSAQPYCRVAAYGLLNSGDGLEYFLEIPFRKDNREAGLVAFGANILPFATQARQPGPLPGMVVDIALRRITFTNVVIGVNATKSLTLNGTLDYPTNVDQANRAACG